ncbi:hypothetical protein JXO59_01075 [candidate division KSB1 bacterium]|nr:hypothetical protein [candidate division KSB1 bacterium]
MKRMIILLLFALLPAHLFSQGKVLITFRHYPTSHNVVRAFVPGTFNGWGPNTNGRISVTAPSLMIYVDSLGCYIKSYLLTAGETHNYKFHEHYDESGSQWAWITDPLNPLINTSDNNNSILQVKNAMIFQLSPKSGSFVTEASPLLMAGVSVSQDDSLLSSQSTITVDGSPVGTFENHILPDLSLLFCRLPGLSDGSHTVSIRLKTRNGETVSDSTRFTVVADDIAFMTPSCDSVWGAKKTIHWRINRDINAVHRIILNQAGKAPVYLPPTGTAEYNRVVNLSRGDNHFQVSFEDTAGRTVDSDTLRLRYPVPQHPQPQITFSKNGEKILITGKAIDPQRKSMTFLWSVQTTSPAPLPEVEGKTEMTLEISTPSVPGDYSLKLMVTDADGFTNSAVNFFTIMPDGSLLIPNRQTAPQWVRDGRMYCLFFKGFTSQGTIAAAIPNLQHIKNMGFNIIWVLPVMDVEGDIDQGVNIGYNIIDFYNVDPVYGTNADFKQFVEQAHALGLRVILDVTPNHSSRSHPIALNVRSNQKYSRYYDFYQHEIISHDTNGLGQSISADGIVYYSGFSSALLNWNWADDEARQYMIEVYRYWLREFDIDGFRFDVYWGPHRRYGVADFDQPLRLYLRNTKADILLLGETNGTGSGSEVHYAEQNGGIDMGYDWNLKNAILSYPSVIEIDNKLYNGGYRPGPNSYFLRFLDNQDEERVAYRYNSIEKTIPVSTAIFMATGMPLLYQGGEVGMGFQMYGSKDDRTRATVNWNNPPGRILLPHYQKLAQIRTQFPAFRRQLEDSNNDGQINSSDASMQPRLPAPSFYIYALARPYEDQNGLAVMNFSGTPMEVALPLHLSQWTEFSQGFQSQELYYLNNLYTNTSELLSGAQLDTLHLSLPAYGVAIYSISTQEDRVELPPLAVSVAQNPVPQSAERFCLYGNYPNPFNAVTRIVYDLPAPTRVRLVIYNLFGRTVRVLIDQTQSPGQHHLCWDGYNHAGQPAATGLYIAHLQAGEYRGKLKMMLLR